MFSGGGEFFARFKGEGRDQFWEAKSLGELKGVVEERLRYYRESRLHSGLGYRTPKEVMEEALGQSMQDITGEAG
jgi:putative transposase